MEIQDYGKKSLGAHIDTELNFKIHVKNSCKNTGRKISILSRFAKYLLESKKKPSWLKFSLNPYSTIASFYGCVMIELLMLKLKVYTKKP